MICTMKQSFRYITALLLALGICQGMSARFTDACSLGLSPDASGSANREILQQAPDAGRLGYPLSAAVICFLSVENSL